MSESERLMRLVGEALSLGVTMWILWRLVPVERRRGWSAQARFSVLRGRRALARLIEPAWKSELRENHGND